MRIDEALYGMQATAYGMQDVSGSHMGDGKHLPLVSTDGKEVMLALAPTLAVPAGLQHQEKMGLVGVKAAVPPSAMPGANSTFSGAAVREAWPFLVIMQWSQLHSLQWQVAEVSASCISHDERRFFK